MSLFVNPSGKIVLSASGKPIECLICPCETIFGDAYTYCVKEEFYSGDGCTGTLLQTLEHQCLCMTVLELCSNTWDKVAFCQGRVKYTYESGPHFITCPDMCLPVACPTNCVTCPNPITVTASGFVGCAFLNGAHTLYCRENGNRWNDDDETPDWTITCSGASWSLSILGGLAAVVPLGSGGCCPTGTFFATAGGPCSGSLTLVLT